MLRAPLKTAAKLLEHQEGLCLKAYKDSTGHLTIGYGREIQNHGITESEAYHLLSNDIVRCYKELFAKLPWYNTLDDVRQLALLSMVFNLGIDGLLKFERMLAHLKAHDYQMAGAEALDSLWARQVGRRALETANMFINGELPDAVK